MPVVYVQITKHTKIPNSEDEISKLEYIQTSRAQSIIAFAKAKAVLSLPVMLPSQWLKVNKSKLG